jgi:hypothetical protein
MGRSSSIAALPLMGKPVTLEVRERHFERCGTLERKTLRGCVATRKTRSSEGKPNAIHSDAKSTSHYAEGFPAFPPSNRMRLRDSSLPLGLPGELGHSPVQNSALAPRASSC